MRNAVGHDKHRKLPLQSIDPIQNYHCCRVSTQYRITIVAEYRPYKTLRLRSPGTGRIVEERLKFGGSMCSFTRNLPNRTKIQTHSRSKRQSRGQTVFFTLYGLNFPTAKSWQYGCTILDLEVLKPVKKVKIQPGSAVPCEQSKNIESFRVNEVSCQIFLSVKNLPGARASVA